VTRRRAGIAVAAILLAGLVVFALSRLEWSRIGHPLITATPGWVALALVYPDRNLWPDQALKPSSSPDVTPRTISSHADGQAQGQERGD